VFMTYELLRHWSILHYASRACSFKVLKLLTDDKKQHTGNTCSLALQLTW